MKLERAVSLVRVLASAVQAAHARNIIHRDLKPGNILRGEDGSNKITDFGIAKQFDDPGANAGSWTPSEDAPTVLVPSYLTQAGMILGTPAYMVPEQARGDVVGPSADLYALGAILYECVTGRPPFNGTSSADLLERVKNERAAPIRQRFPKVSRDLEAITLKCLEKDPAKRLCHRRVLARDLKRHAGGYPVEARPVRASGSAS